MTQNNEKLNRFISLLEGIFELNKADLDFGIYRIMNIRKDEIKQFLSVGLPKKVQEALAPFAADTGEIANHITEIEQQAADLGAGAERQQRRRGGRSIRACRRRRRCQVEHPDRRRGRHRGDPERQLRHQGRRRQGLPRRTFRRLPERGAGRGAEDA